MLYEFGGWVIKEWTDFGEFSHVFKPWVRWSIVDNGDSWARVAPIITVSNTGARKAFAISKPLFRGGWRDKDGRVVSLSSILKQVPPFINKKLRTIFDEDISLRTNEGVKMEKEDKIYEITKEEDDVIEKAIDLVLQESSEILIEGGNKSQLEAWWLSKKLPLSSFRFILTADPSYQLGQAGKDSVSHVGKYLLDYYLKKIVNGSGDYQIKWFNYIVSNRVQTALTYFIKNKQNIPGRFKDLTTYQTIEEFVSSMEKLYGGKK